MDIVLAIVFLYALWHGLRGAGRGVRNAYGRKVDAWDAEHPGVPWPVRRGAMLGYLFSMLRDGGPALVSGFKDGWELGKAKGAEKWSHDQPDPQAAQERVDPNQGQPPAGGGATPGSRPDLRLVPPAPDPTPGPVPGPGPQPAPDGAGGSPNGKPGGSPVATEVVNVETLLAFCQETERDAATESEDAKATKARVEAAITATKQAITAMDSLQFVDEDVAKLVAVQEAEKANLAAVNARIGACDKQLAAAKAATAMAARHVAIAQQKAAGKAYAGG